MGELVVLAVVLSLLAGVAGLLVRERRQLRGGPRDETRDEMGDERRRGRP